MTAPATADRSVAMIGGGQMALALAEGFCRAGLLAAGDIVVYDPHPPARERLAAAVPGVRFAAAAAAAAARYASVHGGSPGQACPAGPANETVAIPQATAACPYPSPSKQSIVDTALARAATAAGTVSVQVCYFREEDTPCSGNTDSTTNAPGALVRVTVRAQLGLVVTSLLGNRTFDVAGTATMVINY